MVKERLINEYCNLPTNTRMQIAGSFAPPQPGCLPRLQQKCASTACQTACHTRRAVPLAQQFNRCNVFRHACMQHQPGSRSSRGSKAIVPQALFQNMFKSDEGGKTRKKYQQRVDRINSMESRYEQMDDDQLKQQTEVLRSRVGKGEALESVLPEAFAVSRSYVITRVSLQVLVSVTCRRAVPLSTQRTAARAMHTGMHSQLQRLPAGWSSSGVVGSQCIKCAAGCEGGVKAGAQHATI